MERALSSRLVRLENANEMAVDRLDPRSETSLRFLDECPDANDNLVDQIRELQACTLRILRRAEAAGKTDTALKVMREVRCNMELLARLTGRFDQSEAGVTAVILMPGPSDIREDCVDALIGPEQVVDIETLR